MTIQGIQGAVDSAMAAMAAREQSQAAKVCTSCGATGGQCSCFDSGFEAGIAHVKAEVEASGMTVPMVSPKGRASGSGKGSRLRKYTCGCGQIVRAATDTLDATCNKCNTPFSMEVAVSA